MTVLEIALTNIAKKLAGFLVIKWHNAKKTGDAKLADEIWSILTECNVQIAEGALSLSFQIPDTKVMGGIILPEEDARG